MEANPLIPEGEILILAGDIIPFRMIGNVNWFFDYISENFYKTYWIPGNHEYYGGDIREKEFSFMENIRSNVFLINNQSVLVNDTKLIFTTLWSYIWPDNVLRLKSLLSVFGHIQYNGGRFTPGDFNSLYLTSRRFIYDDELSDDKINQIVVTHHVPRLFNFPPEFINSNINDAFASELDDMIEKTQPKAWIYGHHHRNITHI